MKNTFTKAVGLSLALAFTGLTAPRAAAQENALPPNFYASDKTAKEYGTALKFIAPYVPKLKTLVISGEDITKDSLYRSHYYFGLIFDESLPWSKIELNARDSLKKVIVKNIFMPGDGKGSFISSALFSNLLQHKFSEYYEVVAGVTKNALNEAASVVHLGGRFDERILNAAIVTIQPKVIEPNVAQEKFSGVPTRYFKPMAYDPEKMKLFILGHEIYGHAENRHRSARVLSDSLGWERIEHTCNQEGAADVAAGRIVREWERLDKSNADSLKFLQAMADYRALAVFFGNPNEKTMKDIDEVNDHITTHMFDPRAEDCAQEFNAKAVPRYSEIPVKINTIIDMYAGYHVLRDLMIAGIIPPDRLAPVSEKPEYYAQHGHWLRKSGFLTPQVKHIPAMYEYYHACFVHFVNKGGLEKFKSTVDKSYHAFIDDIVADYLSAVERQCNEKFVDQKIIDRIEKRFEEALTGFEYKQVANVSTPAPVKD